MLIRQIRGERYFFHVGTRNAYLSRPNLFLPLPINGYQMANKKISPVCVRLCSSVAKYGIKGGARPEWPKKMYFFVEII